MLPSDVEKYIDCKCLLRDLMHQSFEKRYTEFFIHDCILDKRLMKLGTAPKNSRFYGSTEWCSMDKYELIKVLQTPENFSHYLLKPTVAMSPQPLVIATLPKQTLWKRILRLFKG